MNPIVGIGELLWDVYPDGRKVAGGAPFNFAFHCHQLGHPAVIVSRVGDDDLGRELRVEVHRLGLSDEFIQTDREHPTGTVKVMLDENKVPTYTITEDVAWDYIEWNPELERLAATRLNSIAAVCFGSLAQRSTETRSTIDSFLKAILDCLIVFDVNIRGELTWEVHHLILNELPLVHWLKVNVDELYNLLDGPAMVASYEPLPRKDSGLRILFDPGSDVRKLGILTRGSRSTAITDWQRTEWIPSVPANVVNTVGAGDAFTAAMVCLHLEGRPLRDCARFANHYAARVCEHQGATPQIQREPARGGCACSIVHPPCLR